MFDYINQHDNRINPGSRYKEVCRGTSVTVRLPIQVPNKKISKKTSKTMLKTQSKKKPNRITHKKEQNAIK